LPQVWASMQKKVWLFIPCAYPAGRPPAVLGRAGRAVKWGAGRADSVPFAKLSAALTKIHTKSAWWSLAAYGTLHTKKEVSNESDPIRRGRGWRSDSNNNKDRQLGPAIRWPMGGSAVGLSVVLRPKNKSWGERWKMPEVPWRDRAACRPSRSRAICR
jgi:hypothetical protein